MVGPSVEVEKPGHLLPDAGDVGLRAARWTSRFRSSLLPLGSPIMPVAPPTSGDRPVAGLLEPPQEHQRHQVAHVQAVGRGIEAGVDRAGLLGEPGFQVLRRWSFGESGHATEFGEKGIADFGLGKERWIDRAGDAGSAPHVVAGEGMGETVELRLRERLEGLLGQPEVFPGGDLEIHRRARDDRHGMAGPLDQLGLVGGAWPARRRRPRAAIAAKDLRGLGLPEAVAADGLGDLSLRRPA